MALSHANETLTTTVEEQIKISNLGELKDRLGVSELPSGVEELTQPIEVTKHELSDLRHNILGKGTPENLRLIKEFLSDSRREIVDGTRIAMDQFKIGPGAQELAERLASDGNNLSESLSDSLSEVSDITSELGDSEVGKKVQEMTQGGIKKAKEVATSVGFMEAMKQWSENGGIIAKFLGGFMLMIAGLFGFGGTEDLSKKVDEVREILLSPEEREETIQQIKLSLIESHPKKAQDIEGILNNPEINEKQLQIIANKLAKGETLTFVDISKLVPNIEKILYSEEERAEILEKAKQKIVLSLKTGLEKEYPGIEITGDKLIKLEELCIEYFNLSESNSLILKQIVDKKSFQYKELYGTFLEATGKGTAFSLSLVSNEIIPITAVGLDMADTSLDIMKVSLGWLGVTEKLSFEELAKSFETLENKELLLGLLYRKGGYLFSILGKITETVSRAGIESVTSTNVKSLQLIKGATTNNYTQLADNFDTLAKSLGDTKGVGKEILNETFNNFKGIQNNYRVLDALKQNPSSLDNAIKAINDLKIKDLHIVSATGFDDLAKQLEPSFRLFNDGAGNTGRRLVNTLGFYGANSEIVEINRKLESIIKSQKSFLTKGLFRHWNKLFEVADIAKVSRLGERMVLNFDNIEQVKKFSVLANKAPELLGGFIDKLPIFTVAGLILSKDDPSFETLQTELKYLFPIIGPIWMIGEGGLKYNEATGSIEVLNPGQTAIGGVLLGLDTVFFAKAIAGGKGVSGGVGYLLKPVKDIYSIGKGGLEVAYNLSRVSNLSNLRLVAKSGIKTLSKIPKVGKIAAAIIGAGLLASNAMADDSRETIDQLTKEGFINNGKPNYKKIKEEIDKGSLTAEDKHSLIEVIIASNAQGDLDDINIAIKEGRLKIISHNPNAQKDWIIHKDAIMHIESLFGIEYNSNDFQYIEA